eukprot:scaffold109831_cov54-Phaeocystis_antarctica.AAC.2
MPRGSSRLLCPLPSLEAVLGLVDAPLGGHARRHAAARIGQVDEERARLGSGLGHHRPRGEVAQRGVQVVRRHAPLAVAPQRAIDRRVCLDEARRQEQPERGCAVLGLTHREVVVPDAVGAVVGEEEEGGVGAQQWLHLSEEAGQRLVEDAEAMHEVLVRRHQVEQPHARRALLAVEVEEVVGILQQQLEGVGVVAALPHGAAAEGLPRVVVRHALLAKLGEEELTRRGGHGAAEVAAAVVYLLEQESDEASAHELGPHRLGRGRACGAVAVAVGGRARAREEGGVVDPREQRHHVRDGVVADGRVAWELVHAHAAAATGPAVAPLHEQRQGRRAHAREVGVRGGIEHEQQHAQPRRAGRRCVRRRPGRRRPGCRRLDVVTTGQRRPLRRGGRRGGGCEARGGGGEAEDEALPRLGWWPERCRLRALAARCRAVPSL